MVISYKKLQETLETPDRQRPQEKGPAGDCRHQPFLYYKNGTQREYQYGDLGEDLQCTEL